MRKLIILPAILLMALSNANAQEIPALPIDPQVRIGQLDNGLTYYIRHNEEPKGQANFYIAQKVGSILEDENQRGLAHFLEHMCFNGTGHFPGNGIIKYCESIGVKFGADLNAYTDIDETVYNIDNVPVATVPSAIDSCLWILHDWADGLLLEDDDIDHERGVIHEEWRSRMNAQMRMYETILPEMYPGNLYGVRLPIGTMEVVDNFPYKAIRDYYEKWYRPDQQGIVVVGDIDIDEVEAKVKSIFGTIAHAENPAERFYVQVEDNEEPIISIAKDKEQPYSISYIFWKHDNYPDEMKGNINYAIYKYILNVADIMVNERLTELSYLPDPPFIQSSISDGMYFISKTKSAYTGVVVSDESKVMNATTTTYREMLRAIRNGFTASEYDRARNEFLSQIESSFNQRDKKNSSDYCSEYVRHFIDNEPIMGIENEYVLTQQLTEAVTVEMVNSMMSELVSKGNLAVALLLPDKEGVVYPSKAEVRAALEAVEAEDIAPYEDKVSDEPLISKLPVPGKVKKTKDAKFGFKQLILSNGVNVYIKKTDLNQDEVILRAFSDGGLSLYPASEAVNLKTVSDLFTIGGVGSFSKTELNKALSGKKVSVSPWIDPFTEGVKANSTPKDIETMFQLNYLYFTSLRKDNEAFESQRNRLYSLLQNAESQPMSALQDSLLNTAYTNTNYIGDIKSYEVSSIDYDRIMAIATERFANAADFNFIIVGAFEEETLIPMIEQYIATLPSGGKKEKINPEAIDFAKGSKESVFTRKMEVPMATVAYFNNGSVQYDLKTKLAFDLAQQALTTELLEEIREKEGGTYGINADGKVQDIPSKTAYMQIVYQTNPDRYEYLNGKIENILENFIVNGPSEENLSKGKEYLLKNYRKSLNENSYYVTAMEEYLDNGVDLIEGYEQTLESISTNDVRSIVKDVLSQGNNIKVIMVGTAE